MTHRHAEDVPTGATAPGWIWGPVTLTDIVRYAGASGDFTPIHHDPAVAAALGLDRVFAMGMLTGSLLGRYLADWLGHDRIRRYAVRFHDKTWLGDTITFAGTVRTADPAAGATTTVAVDLTATAQDGRLLARGTAEAQLPTRAACPAC